MKFTCNKKLLNSTLNTVMKAVYTRTTMPILKCVFIEAIENEVLFRCSDTEISIEKKIIGYVEEKGSIALPAKNFSEIIRKISGEEIEIEIKENDCFIKGGNSNFELKGFSSEDFPKTGDIKIKEGKMKIDSSILEDMIKKTYSFASTDESSGIFTGILLNIKEKEINFVATDKYRLGLAKELLLNSFEKDLIIPSKALIDLRKIIIEEGIEEEINIIIGENRVLFNVNNIIFVSRILDGNYINYKNLLKKEKEVEVKANRKDILDAIDRASIFGKDGNNIIVTCIFENNILRVTSFSEEGKADEKINIEKNGKDIEVSFNARYLKEALSSINDENILLNVDERFFIINPIEKENYIFFISALKTVKRK